jgi:hypothetical protein
MMRLTLLTERYPLLHHHFFASVHPLSDRHLSSFLLLPYYFGGKDYRNRV